MARQLRAAGQAVALLAVIDGDAPAASRPRVRPTPAAIVRSLTNAMSWIVDDLTAPGSGVFLERLGRKGRRARHRVARRVPGLQRNLSHDIRDELGASRMPESSVPWLLALNSALSSFLPERYSGTVSLFRARTSSSSSPSSATAAGRQLAARVDVHVVKGNHLSILRDPIVARLAEVLDQGLQLVD